MATNSGFTHHWRNDISSVCIQLVIGIICLATVSASPALNGSLAVAHLDEPKPSSDSISKVLSVTEVEQPRCDVTANCTHAQICLNGRCLCKPNYAIRNGQCHQQDCLDNPIICSEQDPNRECDAFFGFNRCSCKDGFIEDPLTLICRPKCVSDQKHMCEHVDSVNSLCNVYRCQCKANFRRNSATGQCEPFRCDYDSQCWSEGDKYRSCVNGTCACTYEEDPITQRCMLKLTSLFKIRYYYSWHTERILLATIFFVPIIFYYCVMQNFRRAKSTVVAFRAPRPGEQFYSNQSAISIQSPKFKTTNGPCEFIDTTEVKKAPPTKTDPNGESKDIKYQRFS